MPATTDADKSRHAELVCSLINYFFKGVREASLSASPWQNTNK
jgi:hypothetical protein